MGIRRFLGWAVAGALAVSPLAVAATSQAASHGVVTFAEAPGASPNFIFPFASCQYDSISNINQFQELMFRPLYWFGLGGSAALVEKLSLADAPRFTDANRVVTITLKGWRFADGQRVDARAVMFFLNMYRADPTAFCGYNAGFAIPDQIRSATGTGDLVRITFAVPVNPSWLIYNYLSQITPLPNTWDRTSPTRHAGCATGAFGAAATKTACTAVVTYLSALGAQTSTFAKPLWQSGVDGPWRLSDFSAQGSATFKANPHYSGPQRAQVRTVVEVPYTSAQQEQADLKAGRLSLGYLDPSVLAAPPPSPGKPGPNWAPLVSTYSMSVGSSWGFNYAAVNFSSADPESAALKQLYIREAMQMSVNQGALIQGAFNGYGTPVVSPLPANTPRSLALPVPNPYPYNPNAAAALLINHGWTMENGVLTCTSPGTASDQCGPGITAGYTLAFNVVEAGNAPALNDMMNIETATWRGLGIAISLVTASFSTVTSDCQGGSGFEICAWGTGWTYSPGYYPSGESLFSPGGGFNVGSYNDPKMTSLINATIRGTATLTAYATYAARQLPVLYQPQETQIIESIRGLKSSIGFTPNPLGNFMPEYLHF